MKSILIEKPNQLAIVEREISGLMISGCIVKLVTEKASRT
ncbi:Uncharacterised protein [Escherichia coli]|nr:Uncharacterised protein [Escherichia coli]